MRKLNIIICLSFAFILGSAGSSAALPQCSAESDYWNNCFGTRTYDNEYKYVGEFKDNKKHGQGTYTFKNGTKQTGFFLNGSFVPYLCQEMGLTKGTDAFGQCVIKLIDEVNK